MAEYFFDNKIYLSLVGALLVAVALRIYIGHYHATRNETHDSTVGYISKVFLISFCLFYVAQYILAHMGSGSSDPLQHIHTGEPDF